MTTLKGLYSRSTARYMFYRAELARVLTELDRRGIPAVVLKGAALVETIYKEPGLRPMVDLDILVPLGQSQEAYEAVKQLGYRPSVNPDIEARMRERDRQLAALTGIGKPVVIELHTHIVEVDSPMRLDIGRLWDGARKTTIAGRPALVLQPEQDIAYLCFNFFKDRRFYSYSALGQLCDLAEVCRRSEQVNWSAFAPGGSLAPLAGPVFCGLYLTRHLLGAPVPDEALKTVAPPGFRPESMRRLAEQRVLNREFVARELVKPDQENYGLLSALLEAVRRTLPSPAYMANKYNLRHGSKLVYFYYPRRIAEGIVLGIGTLARPGRLKDDLAVDRWLHSLQHVNQGRPARPRPDREESAAPARPASTSIGGPG